VDDHPPFFEQGADLFWKFRESLRQGFQAKEPKRNKLGCSPERAGKKGPNLLFHTGPGDASLPGQDSIGGKKIRIRESLLGFRKAPVPDPLADNRRLGRIRTTKEFSDANR